MQMKSAMVLVAAALLFWGWRTQLLPMAGAMALTVAASPFVRRRLELGKRELARLWDFTLVLIIGALIYNRQTMSISGAVITFIQWLPILLFPFIAAFFYSAHDRVPHSTFFFWWRGQQDSGEPGINLTYPYFGLCLLSASAGSARDGWFFPGAVLLMGGALAMNRPRRVRRTFALLAFVGVTVGGFLLQAKWRDFQSQIESTTMRWLAGYYPRQFEDQETHTSLGEVGKLKSSGRIVMAVRSVNGSSLPRLYRQVSFDYYRRGTWLSTRRQYWRVPENPPGMWELAPGNHVSGSVAISMSVPEGRILLPLPPGANRVHGLVSSRLERNRFGNLRVWDSPDPMECSVEYDVHRSGEPPPSPKDLDLQASEEPVLKEIIKEAGLDSIPAERAVEKLGEFFQEKFRYLPFVREPAGNPTDGGTLVASFLRDTRAGHCEYFATAGVLLLRKAGIPARYATGYAAFEPTHTKNEFLVRERHAHAWVLAYIDGRWRDFDPTPGNWNSAELRHASIFRPWADRWADLRFRWATAHWFPAMNLRSALYLVFPLTAILGLLSLKKRGRLRVKRQRPSLTQAYAWPGLDSEFFLIESRFEKKGLLRTSDETSATWLRRITSRLNVSRIADLMQLLSLHYRYRFDPLGLTGEEREQLATRARAWLAQQERT
jgi:hypothetical protein